MINLGLVLAETNGKLVQLVHKQRNTRLLNASRRHSQRLTELVLFSFVAPVA